MVNAVPILLYHSIDTQSAGAYHRWTLSPAAFERQMNFLAENSYRPVTVSALLSMIKAQGSLPPRLVAITFDDGLRDFLTGAVPILQRYNFPATLYVVSGSVGATSRWLGPLGEGNRPMLTWDELRYLSSGGVEIGAHTHSHPQLDLLAPSAASDEINRSKSILEEHLGQHIESFAYPHGYASRATRRLVREAGFTSACRVRHALSSPAEDLFTLSRIMMTPDIGGEDLKHFLDGQSLPIAPPHDRMLSSGWRLFRRIRHLAGVSG